MGFARLVEQTIRDTKGIPAGKKLDTMDRVAASTIGGALGCWNQVRLSLSLPFPYFPLPRIPFLYSPCSRRLHNSRTYLTRLLCTSEQPIEVVRVEMQSMAKGAGGANRPAKPTIANTLSYIYKENGIKGLYRGVTPRIGLGIWQTVRLSLPVSFLSPSPSFPSSRALPDSH